MHKKALLIVFLSLTALSCARKTNPQYFGNLIELTSPQSSYESDGLYVYFHTAMFYGDEIAMDVIVTNYTDEAIEVFPMDWNYLITYPKKTFYDPELHYLVNPVQRLDDYQKTRKSAKQWWKRPLTDLVITGAGIATGSVIDTNDWINTADWVDEGADNFMNSSVEIGQVIKAGKEAAFWESVILKPTILAPGKSVKGLIFFEYVHEAVTYDLFVNLGDHKIKHVVRQRYTTPDT